jgi:hypothetical protein
MTLLEQHTNTPQCFGFLFSLHDSVCMTRCIHGVMGNQHCVVHQKKVAAALDHLKSQLI